MTPYKYLTVNTAPLIDFNYLDLGINPTKSFVYTDLGCDLLKPELKQFFIDRKLEPELGNLWAREPNFCPASYHTDQIKSQGNKTVKCAINWLLSGEPGITEWSHEAKNYFCGNGAAAYLGTLADWYDGYVKPSFVAVLDRPMLIQVDVPHRVNTLGVNTLRISYSLRFKNHPDWDYCVAALNEFIE
jgi:hypothetical protein